MQIEEPRSHSRSSGFFRRRKLPFRQRNAAFLRHNPYRLRKTHVLDLANKREQVPRRVAAKAVKELLHAVYIERPSLFLVEGT